MVERKAPARKPRQATVPEPPEPAEHPIVEVDPTVEVSEPHPVGFVGFLPDDTPNEHYTLAGVISGKPVPGHDR